MLRSTWRPPASPTATPRGWCSTSTRYVARCATLADAAGVSPRVVQKLMRHSTLELTGRYTRPRAVDIEAAAGMLPSLKPAPEEPQPAAMTGTDSRPVSAPSATPGATLAIADACNTNADNAVASIGPRTSNPKVVGSNPTGRLIGSLAAQRGITISGLSACHGPRESRSSTRRSCPHRRHRLRDIECSPIQASARRDGVLGGCPAGDVSGGRVCKGETMSSALCLFNRQEIPDVPVRQRLDPCSRVRRGNPSTPDQMHTSGRIGLEFIHVKPGRSDSGPDFSPSSLL